MSETPESIWIDSDRPETSRPLWRDEPIYRSDVEYIRADLARTPPPEDERRRDATVSVRFVDLSEGTEVRWWQGVAESIRVGFTAHLSKAEQARMATLLRAALAREGVLGTP